MNRSFGHRRAACRTAPLRLCTVVLRFLVASPRISSRGIGSNDEKQFALKQKLYVLISIVMPITIDV